MPRPFASARRDPGARHAGTSAVTCWSRGATGHSPPANTRRSPRLVAHGSADSQPIACSAGPPFGVDSEANEFGNGWECSRPWARGRGERRVSPEAMPRPPAWPAGDRRRDRRSRAWVTP